MNNFSAKKPNPIGDSFREWMHSGGSVAIERMAEEFEAKDVAEYAFYIGWGSRDATLAKCAPASSNHSVAVL